MNRSRNLPVVVPGMAPMAPKRNAVVAVCYLLALAVALPAVPV